MYLFFDTETTGIPADHNAPASNTRNWPRLVQIAWLMVDEFGKELRSAEFIIRPDGFTIPAGAANVHGITTEIASRAGIPLKDAISHFSADLPRANVLVAHNIQFDERIVGAEFFRLGAVKNPLDGKSKICTMRTSTEFCRLPGPYGYKWPTLEELHKKLFQTGFGGAHQALVDVRACAKCFFELQRKKVIGA